MAWCFVVLSAQIKIIEKGKIMKRAIKFLLKNGKSITIRRIRGADYDVVMNFIEKFSRDIGAIQTNQYAGQPKKDKNESVKLYESKDCLFIGAFDNNNVIGMASIIKTRPNHPYSGRSARIGMSLLHKYTHNGIGGKFFEIAEKWARENNVHKLQAEVRHMNIPSIVNCIKHGFIITGILYDAVCINNKWVHEYLFEKIIEK